MVKKLGDLMKPIKQFFEKASYINLNCAFLTLCLNVEPTNRKHQ